MVAGATRTRRTRAVTERPLGQVIVTVESQDRTYSFDQLSVNFDSSNEEILAAVQPIILEDTGVNISEDDENLYTVKKAENSGNIYVFPKSPAGH